MVTPCLVDSRRGDQMSNEPKKVVLLHHGRPWLQLTESHPKSLDSRPDYKKSTSAKIIGPAGSVVTFYDDQQFRTGENVLFIEKLVDEDIEVPIGRDFVTDGIEREDGMFSEIRPAYRWVLFKAVKRDWAGRNIPIDWDEAHRRAEEEGTVAKTIRDVVKFFGLGKTKSNNYRVDNTSSVRLGN
jgi:hypothetical protein